MNRLGKYMKYVGFHCIAENDPMGLRDWGQDNFASLAKLIIAQGTHISLIGSSKDTDWYDGLQSKLTEEERLWIVDYSGMTTIADIPFVLQTCINALVCVNSSIMHFAVATDCPMVAIVGGTPAKVILPTKENIRVAEDTALEWYNPHSDPPIRFSLLKEIGPERVYQLLEEVLV